MSTNDNENFFTGGRHNVDVIAHRGGNDERPGETLLAFEHAREIGVDVLEMDLRVTRDQQLVLMHNPTVSATTKGWLPVRCYTLAQIQEFNAGYDWRDENCELKYRDSNDPDLHVPTFEEVLKRFNDMRMNVEIKGWHPFSAETIAQKFCRLIEDYEMKRRILVASFHEGVLRVIRDTLKGVAISASTGEVARFVASSKWGSGNYKPNAQAIETTSCTIDEKLVQTAHKHGLKLHGFTVDKTCEMDRLIELGVDGIITNLPQKLLHRPQLKTL